MLKLIPIKCKITPGMGIKSLAKFISNHIENKDVVVIASKVISYCENRLVKLSSVKPSSYALDLASKYSLKPEVVELILQEADEIIGGLHGLILTIKFGTLSLNAGIDTSNVPKGFVILYPKNPEKTANLLRKEIKKIVGKKVGIVIADSRIQPLRKGVSGVAIASSGFEAITDERGKLDLYGKPLKYTFRNVADMLASASELLMGEANEMMPIVIVRGLKTKFMDRKSILSVKKDECIYIKGLGIERKTGESL